MTNVLASPEDVKHILALVDPHTGNYAVFPATDHELINIPVAAARIDLFSLFFRDGEIDDPDLSVHETGLVVYLYEDSTLGIPYKDLPGFPLPSSVPADFQVGIVDFDQPRQFRGIGVTDFLALLWRPVQLDEITQQHVSLVNTVSRVRERKLKDQDPHDLAQSPGQDPDRHLHVVPAAPGLVEVPEPVKPAPDVHRRSVGRTRKFAYLHPRIWDLMEADGLSMRDIEVYRFLYTHRKYAEESRIRAKGKGPAYPLPYTITLQSQITEYLKVKKSDLLATARGKRRHQARKMGTSRSTVQRAIRKLCRLGYLGRVYPGRPKICPWLSDQEQDRRIQRHERVPQWGPQKYILATDKCQRDFLKGRNRKLKDLGLPPYLIYLPGPRF